MTANTVAPSRPEVGELRAAQVNPGWAWYRIDQNNVTVALLNVEETPALTEKWFYGEGYTEPSAQRPEGVALSFYPVTQSDFDKLMKAIKVKTAYKHTLEVMAT